MNIDEKFQSAFHYHSTGDLQRAKRIYREILEIHPDHIPALHLLGVVFYQMGAYDAAIEYIRKSLVSIRTIPMHRIILEALLRPGDILKRL